MPYPFESLVLRAGLKGDAKDAAQDRCGLTARNRCESVPAAVHLPLRHNRAGLAFGDSTGRHHADDTEEKDLESCRQAQPELFAAQHRWQGPSGGMTGGGVRRAATPGGKHQAPGVGPPLESWRFHREIFNQYSLNTTSYGVFLHGECMRNLCMYGQQKTAFSGRSKEKNMGVSKTKRMEISV